MLKDYEINIYTLALIPIKNNVTKVIEEDNEFLVNKKTIDIIDDSCKFFGSSYIGRHTGTKNLIGINYKSPIVIEESNEIIFFPTSSPRFNECCWLSLKNIKNYIKKDNCTKIIFNNEKEINIKISYGSLKNQILRSTLLESVLRSRKNYKKNTIY